MLLQITWWELIALMGLMQSLLLVVYMIFRAGQIKNVSLAIGCFVCLALAFLVDFSSRFLAELPQFFFFEDIVWYMVPAFSVLLAMQVAKVDGFPERKYFALFIVFPLAALAAWPIGSLDNANEFKRQLFAIVGSVSGGISLLCLWFKRELLDNLIKEKSYKSDRYWIILCLVLINCTFIFTTIAFASSQLTPNDWLIARCVLGCGLVYLASTSLFRIYPQTLKVLPKVSANLSQEEAILVKRLEELISLQKVYQEPSYSRADFAQELKTSEAAVSKIVNVHFGKSVPQLLNEKRIEDACRMLVQTDAAVSVIAEQVGFNSLPSFNRVFKELTGQSPSEYRAQPKEPTRQKA